MIAFLKKIETTIVDDSLRDYIQGGISTITDNNVTSLPASLFASCYNLREVNFPNLSRADYKTFENCYNLVPSKINIPTCEYIGQSAFAHAAMYTGGMSDIDARTTFDGCKSVANGAFDGCGIKELYFNNCKYVDCYAFENMHSLAKFIGPKIETLRYGAFYSCTSLTYADIGNVSTLESSTFHTCVSLNSVVVTNVQRMIGNSIFAIVRNLSYLSFPNCSYISGSAMFEQACIDELYFPKLTDLKNYPFKNGEVKYIRIPKLPPSNWEYLFNYACYPRDGSYYGLEKVELGDWKSCSIARSMFEGCRTIETITGVDKREIIGIGEHAFKECYSLKMFPAPNCLSIGSGAFSSCGISTFEALECTYLGAWAFASCSNLKTVNLPKVSEVNSSAFKSCCNLEAANFENANYVGSGVFEDCSKLTMLNIKNCAMVDQNAFKNCTELSTVNINKLEIIGSGAFWGCSKIETVEIENGDYIYGAAFGLCINLSYVSIGGNVTFQSDAHAFHNCNNLKRIDLNGLPRFGSSQVNVFYGLPALEHIEMNACSVIGYEAFRTIVGTIDTMYNVKKLYLNSCEFIGSRAFVLGEKYDYALSYWHANNVMETLELPKCKTIQIAAFAGYEAVSEITLPCIETIEEQAFLRQYMDENAYAMYPSRTFILNGSTVATIGKNALADVDGGMSVVRYDKVSLLVPQSLWSQYIANCTDGLSSRIFKIGSDGNVIQDETAEEETN